MTESTESTVIVPSPGLVVKGLSEDGQKVFLNICYSAHVRNPHQLADGRIRIPMSISEPKVDMDRKGNPCLVIDTVVSEEAAKNSTADLLFKAELVDLIVSQIQAKHKLKVGSLRALKLGYKGGIVRAQRIRLEKSDIVQDVRDYTPKSWPLSSIPTFDMVLLDPGKSDEINVLELPLFRSTEKILRENMRSSLGRAEASTTANIEGYKYLRITLYNIINPSTLQLKVSSERLIVCRAGLTDQPELNVCISSYQTKLPGLVSLPGQNRSCNSTFLYARWVNYDKPLHLVTLKYYDTVS